MEFFFQSHRILRCFPKEEACSAVLSNLHLFFLAMLSCPMHSSNIVGIELIIDVSAFLIVMENCGKTHPILVRGEVYPIELCNCPKGAFLYPRPTQYGRRKSRIQSMVPINGLFAARLAFGPLSWSPNKTIQSCFFGWSEASEASAA
jgi:hypothetical protein